MMDYSLLVAKPVIGSLASSKPLATTRSVSLFRPTETGRLYSRCFLSTKSSGRETDCEYNFNLKIPGRCKSSALDLCNDLHVLCHRLPATRNLARLLNFMDGYRIRDLGVTPCGHPRWNVIQDAKSLYLFYNMSGFPKMEASDQIVDHKDYRGSVRDFFRHVCVSNIKGMSEIIVEENARDPKWGTKLLYSIRLHLRDCIVLDAKVDTEGEVLKITIPKKEGKWIHRITVEPKLSC